MSDPPASFYIASRRLIEHGYQQGYAICYIVVSSPWRPASSTYRNGLKPRGYLIPHSCPCVFSTFSAVRISVCCTGSDKGARRQGRAFEPRFAPKRSLPSRSPPPRYPPRRTCTACFLFSPAFCNGFRVRPLLVCITSRRIYNAIAITLRCPSSPVKLIERSLRRLQVVPDGSDRHYDDGVTGQVNEAPVHSYTGTPGNELTGAFWVRSLAKATEGSSSARACSGSRARSFVWRLIPVSRLDKPKRVILQRLRSRISTRFSS